MSLSLLSHLNQIHKKPKYISMRAQIQLHTNPKKVDSMLTWVSTHPLSNFYSRHINTFLVCFPSRARDSGVQK
jgi:hypothetical protein